MATPTKHGLRDAGDEMKLVRCSLLGAMLVATPAIAADRLTDRDVKELVARIEDGRDRFDNALDDRLKRTIVRGPGGEINVAEFLNDFQENIDRLEERLKPGYAASADVATLLRQASAIGRFFRQQPGGTKGESEWNRLATDLTRLAAAYGAEFPLPDGAAVRRIGDRELEAALKTIADSADRMKRSLESDLKKDASVPKADREAIVQEVGVLSKDAKALGSRVKDGKPSSAEADALMAREAKLRAFIDSHQVPAASTGWAPITDQMKTVTAAYRTVSMPKPSRTNQ
jgi:hypothetical protein